VPVDVEHVLGEAVTKGVEDRRRLRLAVVVATGVRGPVSERDDEEDLRIAFG
jgi:hypothetical protein